MMLKASVVAKDYSDTRGGANSLSGNGTICPQNDGSRLRPVESGRAPESAARHISALLAFLLAMASLIALYNVAQTPRAFSSSADSSGSVQTIREFFATLNEYMETGDADPVSRILAPDALASVPAQGILGDNSGLLTYLLALRSTFPQLRFLIESIDADGGIAVATVRMTGISDSPVLTWPSASGRSQEFFRVRGGRILEHWTTTPGSVLQHPLTVTPVRVEVFQGGHLAIAELAFSSRQSDPRPINAPALIIVQRGYLTLKTDGSSEIVDVATGATSTPEPTEDESAGPGQAIFILEHRAFVRNEAPERATALIATFVADPHPILEHIPVDRKAPTLALNDASVVGAAQKAVYGPVAVRPLAFDDRSIPKGVWELEVTWAVLGPGASLPLRETGVWALTHFLSPAASAAALKEHTPEELNVPVNDADTPAVALIVQMSPAH